MSEIKRGGSLTGMTPHGYESPKCGHDHRMPNGGEQCWDCLVAERDGLKAQYKADLEAMLGSLWDAITEWHDPTDPVESTAFRYALIEALQPLLDRDKDKADAR